MKALVTAGAVVAAFVVLVISYFGFTNTANRHEISIRNTYSNNQNVYDNGWKKVKETAQVPSLATDQLKDLYDSAIKGRYGADGSKAVVQFIREQNPSLDPKLYLQVQQTVESFRNEFQANQTTLISRRQSYEELLYGTFSGRIFNTVAGYPHIDLAQYDIVTSDRTQSAFDSKRDQEIDISGKKSAQPES